MNEPPDTQQIKARLAAEILGLVGDLTDAEASQRLGIAETQVARLRANELGEFTIDRLIDLLNACDRRVEVSVRPAASNAGGA
jgi:predicted XRE-type DNA-binding protein